MYRIIDAWSSGPTIMAFIALILIGSQLIINIMLAVISWSLDDIESNATAANETVREESPKSKKGGSASSPLVIHIQWLLGTKAYANFILLVIIINTLVLSCDHYGISNDFLDFLERVNLFTTAVFCLDMVLSNISVGVFAYWR